MLPVDILADVSKSDEIEFSERLGGFLILAAATDDTIAELMCGLWLNWYGLWVTDGRITIVPAPCGRCIVVVPLEYKQMLRYTVLVFFF